MTKRAGNLFCAVSVLALSWAGAGHAATFVVNSAADTAGAGTLRNALASAEDGDSIVFSFLSGSHITLASQLPVIIHAISITGSNAVVIDGSHQYSGLFINAPGKAVAVNNLTIVNGSAAGGQGSSGGGLGAGGGIFAMPAISC